MQSLPYNLSPMRLKKIFFQRFFYYQRTNYIIFKNKFGFFLVDEMLNIYINYIIFNIKISFSINQTSFFYCLCLNISFIFTGKKGMANNFIRINALKYTNEKQLQNFQSLTYNFLHQAEKHLFSCSLTNKRQTTVFFFFFEAAAYLKYNLLSPENYPSVPWSSNFHLLYPSTSSPCPAFIRHQLEDATDLIPKASS